MPVNLEQAPAGSAEARIEIVPLIDIIFSAGFIHARSLSMVN